MSTEQKDRNLYIKGVPKSVKSDLVIIAENKGTTLSSLLKPIIIAYSESVPQILKIKRVD